MKRKQDNTKTSKRKYVIYGAYGMIILIGVIFFLRTGQDVVKGKMMLETMDDQRSTLWPVLISLVATLLGSLITTYVFLKEALDRTVDEKPYYNTVIKEYRDRTMKFLWYYSVGTLLLMAFVVFLYVMFYFFNTRSIWIMRMITVILYGICMAASAYFLYECIDINQGLFRTAEKMLKRKSNEACGYIQYFQKDASRKLDIEALKRITSREGTLEQWLQIDEEATLCSANISKKKFINRFSRRLFSRRLVLRIVLQTACYRRILYLGNVF